jgi:flavodoxin
MGGGLGFRAIIAIFVLQKRKSITMKRFLTTLLALTVAAAAFAQNNQKQNILVAYFSATGKTEAVAKDLAGVTGATLYEIKPEVKYTDADLDYRNRQSRSTAEMQDQNSRPAFIQDLENADAYDVVFIGFPIWWNTAPRIVNTFIEAYGFAGKTVILFATSGSSNLNNANEVFAAAYPAINWKAGKTLNGASKDEIKAWADEVVR